MVAVAVALSASAGNKIINNKITKVNPQETKSLALQTKTLKKGDVTTITGTQLQAWDATARPTANHALKVGETMFWDFEDEAQLNDWTVLDNDGDGYNWEWIYNTVSPFKTHSGYGCMSSASYDNPTYTALTPRELAGIALG